MNKKRLAYNILFTFTLVASIMMMVSEIRGLGEPAVIEGESNSTLLPLWIMIIIISISGYVWNNVNRGTKQDRYVEMTREDIRKMRNKKRT